jgi:hypothetical protein
MRSTFRVLLASCALAVVSTLLSACATEPPPAVRAASTERMQCDGDATSVAAMAFLRSNDVLQIRPLYSHVMVLPNNAEERVTGAKLLVRPPPGMSADAMTRALQCHSARVVLQEVNGAEVANDPFWLSGRWVHILVTPESGNFAVTVMADTVHDNLEIFGRASRYASDHMLVTNAIP